MQPDPLERFTRQIASWTDELLTHGRYPFRKVAIAPRIVTPSGDSYPDMVLWINRASCMAGGVVFLSRDEGQASFPHYGETAETLGLQNFALWSSRAIEIRTSSPPYATHVRLPLGDNPSPDEFRSILMALLERLKPLAITGAVEPRALSAWHLANLCLLTLESARPGILDAVRRHREEDVLVPPEYRAENLAWHTLFHLLALSRFDLLPESVHAERLEKGMEIATAELPSPLLESCQCLDPAPLTEASAVAFHLLFRRLTQLGWHRDRARMAQTLRILLAESGRQLGAAERVGAPSENPAAWINPSVADLPALDTLISVPGRLPGLILSRELEGLPPVRSVAPSPFRLSLSSEGPIPGLSGRLLLHSFDEGLSNDELLVRLRLSWPNRRFRPPRNTPRWLLGLLHLLGLCAENGRIDIETPPDWPRSAPGHFLLEAINDSATLVHVELGHEVVRLVLSKALDDDLAPLTIRLPAEERTVDGAWLQGLPPSALGLALYLPPEGWKLLEQGDLAYYPLENTSRQERKGLRRFLESSWGTLLLDATGFTVARIERSVEMPGDEIPIPLPPRALLDQLGADELDALQAEARQRHVDRELAQWFSTHAPESTTRRVRIAPSRRISGTAKQDILAATFRDGLPRFPDHYLFDHYRPDLEHFDLPGPLFFQRRFFNQIELASREKAGTTVTVDSDLIAHALLLCSHSGLEQVDLPRDPAVMADILNRYRDDLRALKERLIDGCNRLFEEAGQARSLAKKLWIQQGLPPWESIDVDF